MYKIKKIQGDKYGIEIDGEMYYGGLQACKHMVWEKRLLKAHPDDWRKAGNKFPYVEDSEFEVEE